MDALSTDVKLLLLASLLAAWLGLRHQSPNGSSWHALVFGLLLFSAGLRYTGVWH